ncbi:MAG TPA: hypothetical protein VMS77_06005 [Conexivisphaerales archaeon]|nr:hypothetical protein [Conexivisphaerales archaeon]
MASLPRSAQERDSNRRRWSQRIVESDLRLFVLGAALVFVGVLSLVYAMEILPLWHLYLLVLVTGLVCCFVAAYRAHPRLLAVFCLAGMVLGLLPLEFPPPDQASALPALMQETRAQVRTALSWNGETRITGLTTTAVSITTVNRSADEWVATGYLYTFYYVRDASFDISLGRPPPGGSIRPSAPLGLVLASWLAFISSVIGSTVSLPLIIIRAVSRRKGTRAPQTVKPNAVPFISS